jgi:hypothetical protein
MIQPPDCDLDTGEGGANGDCGHPLLGMKILRVMVVARDDIIVKFIFPAISYFTSFIIISYMIVVSTFC